MPTTSCSCTKHSLSVPVNGWPHCHWLPVGALSHGTPSVIDISDTDFYEVVQTKTHRVSGSSFFAMFGGFTLVTAPNWPSSIGRFTYWGSSSTLSVALLVAVTRVHTLTT